MAQQPVVITFESLYEFSRRERDKDDLLELPVTFLDDVVRYVREKKAILDEANVQNDAFSIAERKSQSQQLETVKKLFRELYERRERKIVDLALNRVKTNSNIVDTSKLMVHERMLFDALLKNLDVTRKDVLHSILDAKLVSFAAQVAENTEDAVEAVDQKTKHVKFTSQVEPFVGSELEEYGPFNQNDEAYLPSEIAHALIANGQAEEIK